MRNAVKIFRVLDFFGQFYREYGDGAMLVCNHCLIVLLLIRTFLHMTEELCIGQGDSVSRGEGWTNVINIL